MGKIKISKEQIKTLYLEGKTMIEIAKIAKCNFSNIRSHLHRMGVEIRKSDKYRKYEIDENFFKVINTEEKAYMLGFLYADGYNQSSKNQVRLTLSSIDAEVLLKFNIFLNYDRPLLYLKNNTVVDLTINSKTISSDLVSLGCTQKKCFTLSFPYNTIPASLVRHFIRGYFDGDGCISISEQNDVQINITGNNTFIEQLQEILIKATGASRTKLQLYKKSCSVFWHGKNACFKVLDYLYKDSTISLDRKNKLYKKIVSLQQ
jgi:intein-encoded DNA endonuclease-like protein